MLLRLLRNQTFIRRFSLAETIEDKTKVLPQILPKMGDTKVFKRKYDGRSKKRQWEDRRTDKGAGIRDLEEPKKTKVEEDLDLTADNNKIKRRKFCLLLGYSGTDYFGMQRNPNTKTIEEDLLHALHKVDLIDEDCYNQVQNMQFQRSCRTDKGVSAIRQIVSLKLKENIDIAKINEQLPEVIRVFGYKRVTKGFNSKTQCDGRTYIYLTPTVVFAPHEKEVSQKDFRLDDETFTRVNKLLENFLGTKNFHNYTSKKKPNDPSAHRFMKSFVMEKPFVNNGVEFAILKVHGQSFMLHQIRKMIGGILAVVRGLATEDLLPNSFKSEKVVIPRAPGLGLMLEYVHYDRYNHRYGSDGIHEAITWEECEDQVKEFKEKYIFPTIIETEIKEEPMIYWLHNKLARHAYDKEENESDNEGGDDEDEIKEDIVKNEETCKSNENKQENV
ncbi:unnamed protein product [Phyllotreta striolata]|uniref:Pseudouridylate synthase 1 homolog n=1 Tax=Phyllotreta striolata TaxID=444603 RepID=A0A9N9XM25_PHYSR|nr:unnamed protein product [Phyllotreta striolata]